MDQLADIRLGTSSFTAAGWNGSFYPKGTKSADRLAFYAEHFDTVEIDSSFYACPSPQTVKGWESRTPAGFIFSVKVPQVITHEKVLLDCDADFEPFVDTMGWLGGKLGPMVLQFPFWTTFFLSDTWFPGATSAGYIVLQILVTGSFTWFAWWLYKKFTLTNLDNRWVRVFISGIGGKALLNAMRSYQELEELETPAKS